MGDVVCIYQKEGWYMDTARRGVENFGLGCIDDGR